MPQRRSSKRRVLILSSSYGAGHQAAAEALARYLRARPQGRVDVVTADFFGALLPDLAVPAAIAYQQDADFLPAGTGGFDQIAAAMPENSVVRALALAGPDRFEAMLEAQRPDAIIATLPIAGAMFSEFKRERGPVIATLFTDLTVRRTWLHPDTDLFFVASAEARENLVLRGLAWDRVVVSGVPVAQSLHGPSEKSVSRQALGLSERFTALLACGGTADAREIASALSDSKVQVAVYAGAARATRSLDALKKTEYVHVYLQASDAHRMMSAADVLVAKAGGAILTEALSLGLPAIICDNVPSQEMCNVDSLVNAGAVLLARDEDDVVEKVRYLARNPERLEQMACSARALQKPAATQTVCERVLAAIR